VPIISTPLATVDPTNLNPEAIVFPVHLIPN